MGKPKGSISPPSPAAAATFLNTVSTPTWRPPTKATRRRKGSVAVTGRTLSPPGCGYQVTVVAGPGQMSREARDRRLAGDAPDHIAAAEAAPRMGHGVLRACPIH